MVVLAAVVLAAVPASARPAEVPVKPGEAASPLSPRVAAAGVASALSRITAIPRATKKARARARARARDRARAIIIRSINPFAALPLYVDPRTPARAQARAWRDSRPADAALIDEIASQPQALWLGDWVPDVRAAAAARVSAARAAGAFPLLVAYNIPNRDCGLHSGGGASDAAGYLRWIDALARGLGAGPAAVILEPDALAADCLDPAAQRQRLALLNAAVQRLATQPGIAVYIDAGNPTWVPAGEIARRLRVAGVAQARGFAINVASFSATPASRAYGRAVASRAGGAPFVIDTGRNGAGLPAGEDWCNPSGRALGDRPTADTGDRLVDALLWVKRPGESDGVCNGGPPAGEWWADYALDLARAGVS
jgi:endoglucanase